MSPTMAPVQTPGKAESKKQNYSPAGASPGAMDLAPLALTGHSLLTLQRLVGNQAVQRLLAREAGPPKVRRTEARAAAPIGPEGGAVTGDVERRLRQSQNNGSSLPAGIRRAIEPKLGADLGGVRVHTGRDAVQLNRELGAKAFTHGNHIYYGAGQSPSNLKLTAHEAVHTVQQGGAKRKPIQAKLNVGPANDRYEQEADRIADTVMRSRFAPVSSPQSPEGEEAQAAPVVQRIQRAPMIQRFSLNPKKWTKSGREKAEQEEKAKKEQQQKQEQDTGELLGLSSEYERRLGKYLFNHTRAIRAATTLVNKMIAAIIPEMDEKNKEHQTEIAKSFGKNAKQYAGNVGTDFADVWAALKQGNLREKMTAIYNAMFGTFKDLMKRLMEESAWKEAEKRGFDTRKLGIRQRQLKYNPMAKDPYRKPRAFLDRKKVGTFEFSWDMLKSETRTLKEGSKVTKREVGELEEGPFKAGLSERERKFMFSDKGQEEDISKETLTWEEGGSTWNMKKNHTWVKNLTENLKMPVIAGPSGTAQRFFQVWEWLGKPLDAKDLRLALLGWMLVENDHSFHEIAQMSVEYGLPYTPGQAAYRHLDPLTEAELRKNVATDPKYPGLFPDEIQYHKKMDTGQFALMKPYQDDLETRTSHAPLLEEQFGMKKKAYEKSGLMHLLRPVTAYTTIAYQTINMVAGGDNMLTKKRIEGMLKDGRTKHKDIVEAYRALYVEGKDKADLGDELYAKYEKAMDEPFDDLSFAQRNIVMVLAYTPDVTVEGIIAEAKLHREHVNSGLEVLPTFQGKVYRGEAQTVGIGNSYKKGTKINVKKFLSASRNSRSAVTYAKSSAGIKSTGNQWYSFLRKPFILEMESKSARDVNAVTVNEDVGVRQKTQAAGLDEVVFLPGTVLEVQSDPQPDPAFDNIPRVELKEVKSGGTAPEERVEFNQPEPTSVSGPLLDEDDEEEDVGLAFVASQDIEVGNTAGSFDVTIPEDATFRVIDPDWDKNYKDAVTEWTEIHYQGRTYYAIIYDLLMKAYQQAAPKKEEAKPEKPTPGPINLYMGPDDVSMNFPLAYGQRGEIAAHAVYDLDPQWTVVDLTNDEGGVDKFYAKTDEFVKFISGGAVDKEDVDETESDTESEKTEEEEDAGLDPDDYPAGTYNWDVTVGIKLPASTTPDGKFSTDVELYAGDKIPVTVDDDLTEDYGRCKIVFFSQVYYVPLNMIMQPVEHDEESEAQIDVDEVDEENFVPEEEGATLHVFAGQMDIDPDNEPEMLKTVYYFDLPLSRRGDLSEYEDRGSWTVLIDSKTGDFLYAKTSDWGVFQKE